MTNLRANVYLIGCRRWEPGINRNILHSRVCAFVRDFQRGDSLGFKEGHFQEVEPLRQGHMRSLHLRTMQSVVVDKMDAIDVQIRPVVALCEEVVASCCINLER